MILNTGALTDTMVAQPDAVVVSLQYREGSCSGAGVNKFLTQDFIGQISIIRSLRKSNAVLDEVCENYEEIAACVAEMKLQQTEVSEREMSDFVDTLNALREEINLILSKYQN